MAVRVTLIDDEPTGCDHCTQDTGKLLYAFKFTTPDKTRCQLWLHKACLLKLTEKLLGLEARRVMEGSASAGRGRGKRA